MAKNQSSSDNIDFYMNMIRDYGVYSKSEERIAFDKINKAEDEYILLLVQDRKLITTILQNSIDTNRTDVARNVKLDDLFNIPEQANFAEEFLKVARSNGEIRSLQFPIYDGVMNVSNHLNKEWIDTLKKSRQTLNHLRNEFAKKNLRLVVMIARKYISMCRGVRFPDLVQEGNIGLMKAIEKFDSRIDVRFSTYSSWWIKQYSSRTLIDKNKNVRLPVHLHDTLLRIRRFKNSYSQLYGNDPTIEEIAEHAKIKKEKVNDLLLKEAEMVEMSIDAPSHGENHEEVNSYMNSLKGDDVDDVEKNLHADRIRRIIDNAMSGLDERSKQIIKMRFGLSNQDDFTLQDIGDTFSLSRERIRQLESHALRKMRMKINNNTL